MQCTLAGNDSSGFLPLGLEIFDRDERDADDEPSVSRRYNVGGTSVTGGEGAFLDVELVGGEQYVLVVGAADSGPYEFAIRAIVGQ